MYSTANTSSHRISTLPEATYSYLCNINRDRNNISCAFKLMKMRLPACLCIAIIWTAAVVSAHALEVTDDRGVTIVLERPASRIVTLAPHLAEIAFAAGAGASLVGVSSFSNHPREARLLPVVASNSSIDLERLIALKPQLVLAWQSGNSPLQVARLEQLGYRVIVSEVRRLADIPRIIRLVGTIAGREAVADARAGRFERAIEDLRRQRANEPGVPVFVEIWHRPMLTVNGGHLISDAIRVCGGRNVFADAKVLVPLVSREQLLGARPQAIITGGFGSEKLQDWSSLKSVPAIRRGRIYVIDSELRQGQGPRVIEGIRAVCRQLETLPN